MRDDNRKAKMMTIGIAVVLILVVCGISVIVHALHKRDSGESGDKLQSDILDYAANGQEQSVMTQDVVNLPEQELPKQGEETPEAVTDGTKEPVQDGGDGADAKAENNGKQPDKTAEGKPGEPAVVVENQKTQAAESIIEEEAKKAANTDNQQTTAKWQKEAGENLSAVQIDLPRQMSEMKGYWEAGNMKAVEDLVTCQGTVRLPKNFRGRRNIIISAIRTQITVPTVRDLPCIRITSIITANGKTA